MTLNAFRAAVETTLSGGWTLTPIYYGVDAPHVPEPQWVRVNIYPTSASRVTIGGNYQEREVGAIRIEVFVSEEYGTGRLMTYFETLAALFRGQLIGGAQFQSPAYRAQGRESGWIRSVIDIPYYRDTCY